MKNHISKIFQEYLNSINFSDKSVIEVLRARDPKFGDYSSNIAMRISAKLNKAPMEIAEEIKQFIDSTNNFDIKKTTITKPGFVNLFLSKELIVSNAMKFIDKEYKPNFDAIKTKNINYEYVSANPTGDLHVGHARNAVVGDVSINALKYVGHKVRTEFWVNDGGAQMRNLAESVYFYYAPLMNMDMKLTEENVSYQGVEIVKFAEKLANDNFIASGDNDEERIESLIKISGDSFLNEIKNILHEGGLNIQKFDNWQSEAWTLKNKFPEVFNNLKEIGAIYEKDGATWIKTKENGDEKDRVLIKSDGSYTYMAADVAYHIIKLDDGKIDLMINVWGKDHHGYEPRVQAALSAVGMSNKLEVDFISMVAVMRNGEKFKMSKRAGTSVRITDILKHMNRDVFRYSLIMKGKEQNMEIDLDLISKKDNNNPYYYAQYANARVHQILKKCKNTQPAKTFDKLAEEEKERELMSKIIEFEDVMIMMEKEREPSSIVNYQKELTQSFNSYYAACKVITADAILTSQRIALMISVKNIFETIFKLLGIEPINKI